MGKVVTYHSGYRVLNAISRRSALSFLSVLGVQMRMLDRNYGLKDMYKNRTMTSPQYRFTAYVAEGVSILDHRCIIIMIISTSTERPISIYSPEAPKRVLC